MPNKNEQWSFKPDGNQKNQKYWGKTVTIHEADTISVRYKWDDPSLRDPTKPNGMTRTVASFISKFELVGTLNANIEIVQEATPEKVMDFLHNSDGSTSHTTSSPQCIVCTDDSKELKNGKCSDCRHIHTLLKEFGRKYSIKEYYGFDPQKD